MESLDNLEEIVKDLGGFPILVRPSYVLSGSAMRVAYKLEDLKSFLQKAAAISQKYPVTMSKFEEHAKEIEFDAVAKDGSIIIYAITEHIENAGVHSGDASLVIPAQWISDQVKLTVKAIAEKIAHELNITGPFNVQMLAKNDFVKVIECNLRASRSFPYISKALGVNFIKEATQAMLGDQVHHHDVEHLLALGYVVVKCPQFSFNRLKGTDPRLGVEMASTGEVACFGPNYEKALLASLIATGFKPPKKSILISIEEDQFGKALLDEMRELLRMGLKVYTTQESQEIFLKMGLALEMAEDPVAMMKAEKLIA